MPSLFLRTFHKRPQDLYVKHHVTGLSMHSPESEYVHIETYSSLISNNYVGEKLQVQKADMQKLCIGNVLNSVTYFPISSELLSEPEFSTKRDGTDNAENYDDKIKHLHIIGYLQTWNEHNNWLYAMTEDNIPFRQFASGLPIDRTGLDVEDLVPFVHRFLREELLTVLDTFEGCEADYEALAKICLGHGLDEKPEAGALQTLKKHFTEKANLSFEPEESPGLDP